MIVTSTARVATERPARYGKQLASHLSRKLTTEWDVEARRGTIVFKGHGVDSPDPRFAYDGSGSCDLVSGDNVLLIHIEAPADLIARFEEIIGMHLVRFGEEEGLTVSFRRGHGEPGGSYTGDVTEGTGDAGE